MVVILRLKSNSINEEECAIIEHLEIADCNMKGNLNGRASFNGNGESWESRWLGN